jgi:hypothetical protein
MLQDHPSKIPDDYITRELDTFRKAFEAGNEWGLADAMTFCKNHSVPLPSWALEAILARHADAYHGTYKRTGKWKRQFRQDMIDFGRAETVQECREHGTLWKVVYEIASKMLEGTGCAGKPDAIEKSYKRFCKRMKTEPWRYYIPQATRQIPRTDKQMTKEYSEWFTKTFPEGRYK